MTAHPLVIGVGNSFRSDDGVGLLVARRLQEASRGEYRVIEESGEGTSLMEAWKGAGHVIVCDAVSSGEKPGTIHRLDATHEEIPSHFFHYSTHAFSVAEAVEFARVIGQLPSRLILYGIEGRNFESGVGLSPEVTSAADEVVRRVKGELCTSSLSSTT